MKNCFLQQPKCVGTPCSYLCAFLFWWSSLEINIFHLTHTLKFLISLPYFLLENKDKKWHEVEVGSEK